jgi:hypothetical protein
MTIQSRCLQSFLALALFAQVALAQQSIVELRRQTFEIVWTTVKEKHFDPKLNGVDWEAVHRQYAPRVAAAVSDDEFYKLLNAMLGELKQSHFAVIPPSFFAIDEKGDGKSSRAEVGVTVQMIEGRPTITRIERDSTALAAGLRPGFIVMSIDGKAPDKMLTVTTIDKVGVIKKGFDGKAGWSQDPYQGLRTLEGDELERIRRQAVFNSELKWRELFIKAELAGREKVGEQDAYVYTDYREVDGVKTPFQWTQKTPVGEMIIKITEVKTNAEIDDSRFAKPSSA